MTHSELKRKLREIGCYVIREGNNHEIWFSPKTQKQFPVGRHDKKEVASGTLKSIRRDAGLE
ncbi:MAG: type II toxin-antitoxin system HicA family toxin [Clostridia bacterium]|nr:type II toxin-antitoxin system HicA family toxin [Clostridia bacterium]